MDSRTSEGAGPPGDVWASVPAQRAWTAERRKGGAATLGAGRGVELARADQLELAARDLVAVCAAQLRADHRPAVAVAEAHRAAVVGLPPIGPLHERDERRQQVLALLGEPVPWRVRWPGSR